MSTCLLEMLNQVAAEAMAKERAEEAVKTASLAAAATYTAAASTAEKQTARIDELEKEKQAALDSAEQLRAKQEVEYKQKVADLENELKTLADKSPGVCRRVCVFSGVYLSE